MSLQACANLVARADTARWRAAMAAPILAREILLPIYAANVEISRAPWVTQEPWIAEMRLQWWRDVLDEITDGTPRRHEVVDAFAPVMSGVDMSHFHATIDARRWDIAKQPFTDQADVLDYACATTFGPMASAVLALGGAVDADLKHLATALGTARLLQAVCDLKGAGAQVFPADWADTDTQTLAQSALASFEQGQVHLRQKAPATAALIEAAGCQRFLTHVAKHPASAAEGTIPAFALMSSVARARVARRVTLPPAA